MNKRLLTAMVILFIFVLYSALSPREPEEDGGQPLGDSPLESDFDYYINGMLLDRFGPAGAHQYRIEAERVTHFPDGDYSLLRQPAMDWFDPEQPAWYMDARSGRLQTDPVRGEDVLTLENNVVAETLHPTQGPLTIRTEYLDVLLDSRELHSGQAVTLSSPGTQLQGVGMRYDLSRHRVELLSEVRGQYE